MIVDPSIFDHPKFLRLQRRVGPRALEILIRIWGHCQTMQRGERWKGVNAEYVEAIARWDAEPGKCYESLVQCGFIDEAANGIVIHGWNSLNSSLISSWRNGCYGGRPRKPTGNPRVTAGKPTGNPPETHGLPSGNPSATRGAPEKRREEKRREDTSSLPPSEVSEDGVVESSRPEPPSPEFQNRIETIWAAWPKKIDVGAAQIEIGHAIRRHGFEVVLAGVQAIAAAEARTKSVPRGRYLPRPAEFFAGSRYLDDPAQYGPRGDRPDAQTLRRRVDDLAKTVAEHPGNPANPEGSLERKKDAAEAFDALKAELREARRLLDETVANPVPA